MAPHNTDTLWVVLPTAQQRSGAWIDDTLQQRVREQGLLVKMPRVGQFPRQRVEVIRDAAPDTAVNQLFYQRGWTDGLPIVPPTLGRVEAMLAATDLPKQTVMAELDPLKGAATVEKIAVNAVMAGCRPDYLPVILAAVEALAQPRFNLRGVQTTDENVTPLLILNGPIIRQLQVNAGFGALGPGWQANATLGRAIRLIMHNIGGGWPGVVSFAGLGQPGRYTLCLAENQAASPWPPFHVEQGYAAETSTVTVMRAETAVNVTGGVAEVASVMGSAAFYCSLVHAGKVAVILAPRVAQRLAAPFRSRRMSISPPGAFRPVVSPAPSTYRGQARPDFGSRFPPLGQGLELPVQRDAHAAFPLAVEEQIAAIEAVLKWGHQSVG